MKNYINQLKFNDVRAFDKRRGPALHKSTVLKHIDEEFFRPLMSDVEFVRKNIVKRDALELSTAELTKLKTVDMKLFQKGFLELEKKFSTTTMVLACTVNRR